MTTELSFLDTELSSQKSFLEVEESDLIFSPIIGPFFAILGNPALNISAYPYL